MRIKVTEDSLKLNVDGALKTFTKDDEVTVEDIIGNVCVAQGWADDIAGVVPTGPRIEGAAKVQPNNLKLKVS